MNCDFGPFEESALVWKDARHLTTFLKDKRPTVSVSAYKLLNAGYPVVADNTINQALNEACASFLDSDDPLRISAALYGHYVRAHRLPDYEARLKRLIINPKLDASRRDEALRLLCEFLSGQPNRDESETWAWLIQSADVRMYFLAVDLLTSWGNSLPLPTPIFLNIVERKWDDELRRCESEHREEAKARLAALLDRAQRQSWRAPLSSENRRKFDSLLWVHGNVDEILDILTVEQRDRFLLDACDGRKWDFAEALVSKGARMTWYFMTEVAGKELHDRNAFHVALEKDAPKSLVVKLAALSDALERKTAHGKTPLRVAIRAGKNSALDALMSLPEKDSLRLWRVTVKTHDYDGLSKLCAKSTYRPNRDDLMAVAASCEQCQAVLIEGLPTPEEKALREQQREAEKQKEIDRREREKAEKAAEAMAALLCWRTAIESHDHAALEALSRLVSFKPDKAQRGELLTVAASCEHCRRILAEGVKTCEASYSDRKFACPKCKKVMILIPDENLKGVYACPYCGSTGSISTSPAV